MDDTTKYLIHARIAANGIVERSDVVGAVFGQTEGLLGDELDLRDLQQSSKVGRIDVEITSENGQSFGELTIATSLGKAETAILAASLETINRVGPCRADIEVTAIEDIRAAKRREIVDRAKELLATAFDETGVSGADLVDDVRDSARVADVVDYKGLPAGPAVERSDAVIVVEGRADVRQLLTYGIKNAIAVEGTDVPDAVADLTTDRTTTVFVDGDRGGELILRELLQVGDIDFVAFAPPDRSVEELSRSDVVSRLRQKVVADRLRGAPNVREAIADIIDDTASTADDHLPPEDADTEVEVVPTSSPAASPSSPAESPADTSVADSRSDDAPDDAAAPTTAAADTDSTRAAVDATADAAGTAADAPSVSAGDSVASPGDADATPADTAAAGQSIPPDSSDEAAVDATDADDSDATDADDSGATDGDDATDADGTDADNSDDTDDPAAPTLRSHVEAIIDENTGTARLLDAEFTVLAEPEPTGLIEAIERADAPAALVVDGECSQRLLDVAAHHGLDQVVAASTGEFVKQPAETRVLTAAELRAPEPELDA